MADRLYGVGCHWRSRSSEVVDLNKNFWIRQWLVEPDRLKITKGGQEVAIKPRSMTVLVELARAGGAVVPRGNLIDKVWKGAEVSDDALTQSVVELRRVFGDDARRPRYIETIKRVGIRLIPKPTTGPPTRHTKRALLWSAAAIAAIATGAGWLISRNDTSPPPAAQSIAVLPFANMSAQDADDYFADGLTEEIISVLAAVPELRVPARTSSFAYRDRDLDIRAIGERLNVANVLEGSVRRYGNRVRVTAELIEVGDGYHRWSRSYDHELGDAVAIQQEIAGDVLAALAPQFGFEPIVPTDSGRAYDLFLAGKQHMHAGRFDVAARLFADAVEEDAGFALAHANLAIAVTSFHENATGIRQVESGSLPPLEVARAALRAANLAGLRHTDRFLAEASVAAFEGDLDAEAHALEHAIAQNPSSVAARMRYSANLAARGSYLQALQELEKVESVDPLNAELAVRHAFLLALFSGYGAGIERMQRLIDLDLASPVLWAAMTELAAVYGRYFDRVDYALRWVRAAPEDASAMAELGDAYTELGELEVADRWISAAERLSTTAGFKSRARWLGVSGDWAALADLAQASAATFGTLPASSMPTPVQSAVSGILAVERAHAGDHALAAQLFSAVADASPTLPRRSPHLRVYVAILLAGEYEAQNDTARMNAALADAQDLLDELQRVGITKHPWLTVSQAALYALEGDDDRAEQFFADAIDQGWRAWILEQHGIARFFTGYDKPVRLLENELAGQRSRVRRAGMLIRPEEL